MQTQPTQLNMTVGAMWGGTAILDLPVGPTYEEIQLKTNLTKEQIQSVKVKLNGDAIYDLSGTELVELLSRYRKRYVEDGRFVIPFSDFLANSINGVRYTALVTMPGDSIIIEIKLVNQPQGAAAPSIDAMGYTSKSQPKRFFVPRITKHTFNAGKTGENVFSALPNDPAVQVRRMHFKAQSMQNLEIKRDRMQVYDADKSDTDFQLKTHELSPVDGYFHFDPVRTGWVMAGLFPVARKSTLEFICDTTEVEESIEVIVEDVEQVAQLPTPATQA